MIIATRQQSLFTYLPSQAVNSLYYLYVHAQKGNQRSEEASFHINFRLLTEEDADDDDGDAKVSSCSVRV